MSSLRGDTASISTPFSSEHAPYDISNDEPIAPASPLVFSEVVSAQMATRSRSFCGRRGRSCRSHK